MVQKQIRWKMKARLIAVVVVAETGPRFLAAVLSPCMTGSGGITFIGVRDHVGQRLDLASGKEPTFLVAWQNFLRRGYWTDPRWRR